MKGFNFKFQPILNIKELEENQLIEEYALLRKAHTEALQVVNQLISTKEDQLQCLQNCESEGVLDVNQAMLYRNYLAHLRREIAISKEEESQRREKMEDGFQRMVEKTKEKKILEKLKEKHKKRFTAEQLSIMQKELDDLAQGRFNYQQKESQEAAD